MNIADVPNIRASGGIAEVQLPKVLVDVPMVNKRISRKWINKYNLKSCRQSLADLAKGNVAPFCGVIAIIVPPALTALLTSHLTSNK